MRIFFVLGISLALAACASVPYQTYPGDRLPHEQEAEIIGYVGSHDSLSTPEGLVVICSDHIQFPASAIRSPFYRPQHLYAKPGHHEITLAYLTNLERHYFTYAADLEAGHQYQLQRQFKGYGMLVSLKDTATQADVLTYVDNDITACYPSKDG